DGAPYDNPFICDLDQSVAYSYGFLPGGGNSGPYTLDFWMINGTMHNGAFNNPQELTALMNSIDPNGFWQINPQGSIIFGGDPNTQYGNMQITQVASGIPTVLMTNFTFQPQGFTVSMANPGIHLLVVQDPVTGCSDTLVLNVPFPQPDPETVVLNTTVNTPTAPYCLNGANLPGGVISSIGFCGNPQNGGAPIVSDTCVFYVPNLNFAGQDDFCVVVCDNGFPQVCDTTFFIVNVAPEQDTVYLEIPVGETSVDTCLSSFIIELPGPIDQASFCGINPNQLTGNITANCLEFNTLNNFSGISEVCVEFCSGGFCDLTIVVVNVVPPIVCDEVFLENVITIPSPEAEGFLCIPVAPGNIVNFEVTLDGGPPFTAFAPCNFTDQLFYNYNILPPGPYLLESWTINGTTFMGNFPDINTLIDSMNVWDPMGNWTNNPFGLTINGGVPGSLYGNLVISESQGSVFTISPDAVVLPLGSNMPVNGYGNHQLIMTELNGCADTVTVVLQQYLVNSQTLFFETNLNTSVVPICANTSELLGELQTFNFCELPANGSVTVIGDTCVSYTPNLNFTGVDNFCLLVCDDYQPAVCDTFFVVVNTQLPTDTVYVDADDVVPFEVCLDSTALQLPGSINAAFVCEADAAVVALELSGNCITIDLEDSFVGTTTACVVYCTADVPPICDTTWLIIEFDGVFPCDDIFIPDHINIMLENDTGEVCLPIPVFDIGDYTLLLDGAPYTGQLSGCDVDSVYTYFYSQVFGQGNSGPYDIEWTLNGVVQTATVNDMVALVNLMNGLDPAGNWILDPVMLTISSSNDAGNYGLLQISHPSGSVAGLTPNFNGIPNGTQVVFAGTGNHEVVLIENFTNCDDTLFINGILQMDTIQVTTIEDTPSAQVCIDISGLPANFVEMTVCGQPANGSLLLDNECFIYFPLSGFTGNDQACLHICDEEGNCEVWIVLISVEPMCSQFNFFPNTVVEVAAPDCAAQATFCLPVELDSINNFGVLDNGVTYTGFSVCNGTLTQVALDTGFHELMVVHLATQCADTLLLNVTCTPDNDCGIEPLSGLNLLAADCDSLTEFCVNVAPMDLPNFMVLDNGTPTSLTGPCSSNDQFTGVALNTGFHQIIFADTVKGCADTFLVNVDCIMVEDSTIQITIMEGDSTLVCLGDYGYPLPAIDSLVNICENQSDGNATIQINPDTWCTTVFGEIIGQDTFCLKAYFGDTCAVLTVEVDVVSHCPDFFPGDQLIAATACSADSASVCLPLGPADIANMVVTLNGQVVADAFQPCAFDSLLLFPYSNLPSAGIIGPYEVTDWTVNGESFSGTFNSAAELAALMTLWDNSANWMAGTDSNANTIISGGNFNTDYGTMTVRQTISGAVVMLDIQLQLTPVQYGLLLPMGTSQVIFTDTLNSCPETVVADILCVQTDTLLFDVQVDSSNIYCLDLSELPGNLLSVENNCPGLGGTDVGFEIAGDCVVYTGLDPGADTACIVACDEFGICDTTILIVTAVLNPVDTVLIAMDDQVTTGEEQVILINVLQNDLFTTLTDFNIIDPPAHGQAAFLPNGDINYLPDEGYCDDETPDSFTYEICNASGCDTATVFISILCDNLEIFNGFSPNDDGKNDFFRIKGLQNYPGHHLFIYNRWGNLVYEATNYQSDWNGTWDGKDLPDGTYFYVLDLANGEKPLNGYVQLRR
ncbi:MAG TPA: gliding motility-associated C-terminal domain-containing protein, partial [Bacteroidetes bacterium]|nr:gliding motility-associated C-terminal domain-containing protein [Bacteroidota bacterium]